MSDKHDVSEVSTLETEVAVYVDERFESHRETLINKLIQARNKQNLRRFNYAAERVFNDALRQQKYREIFPRQLLAAPREEALTDFQRAIWNVVYVIADHPGSAKKKLIEHYGKEPFLRSEDDELATA